MECVTRARNFLGLYQRRPASVLRRAAGLQMTHICFKLECAASFDELAIGKDDDTRECRTSYSDEPKKAIDENKLAWPMAIYPSFIRHDTADHSNTHGRQIQRGLAAAMTETPGGDSVVTLPLRPKK